MAVIKILEVLTCGASHSQNTLQSLILGRSKWTSPKGHDSKVLECEVKIPLSFIQNVDLGNYWSSSVQLEVGRTGDPRSKRDVLLFTKILMTRLDARSDKNSQGMHFFKKEDFNPEVASKSWDIVKITCTQPFRKDLFGLSALVIRGRSVEQNEENRHSPGCRRDSLAGAGQLLLDRALGHVAEPKLSAKEAFLFKRKVQHFIFGLNIRPDGSLKDTLQSWYKTYPDSLKKEEKDILEEMALKHRSSEANLSSARPAESRKRPLSEMMENLREGEELFQRKGEKEKKSANRRNEVAASDVSKGSKYENSITHITGFWMVA